MTAIAKKTQKKRSTKKSVTISKKVKSYAKTPFFVKKAEAMETLLKEHGMPHELAHA